MSEQAPTAGIIIIGNEILSGKVRDTNSPYLCKELRHLGVELRQIVTIPDEFEIIEKTVVDFSDRFTWVFTSGGIGPTPDDITIESVARAYRTPLVESPEILAVLQGYYKERMSDTHRRMALIPQGAELIQNPKLLSPQVCYRNIFIFPGIPELLSHRFNSIKDRFRADPICLREIFLMMDEAQLGQVLFETAERFPNLLLGSYPALWRKDYTLKLTLESRDEKYLLEAYDHLFSRLPIDKIISVE